MNAGAAESTSVAPRKRVFPARGLATALGVLVLGVLLWPVFRWGVLDAVFSGDSVAACQVDGVRLPGACWPGVTNNLPLLLGGRYPQELLWRPAGVVALGLASLFVPLILRARPLWLLLAPLAAFPIQLALLAGIEGEAYLGTPLERVTTERWGGFALTWILSAGAILASLIPALGLALARTGSMRLPRLLAAAFIETVRGVPLITLLFVGHFLFPLFLPQGGVGLDELLRAGLALTVFLSAYSAEVWRGGLLAVSRGQVEAATALALPWLPRTRHVVFPQASRVALPGLVATFIGLFKDTSLVAIVGVYDLLGIARNIPRSPQWLGVDVEPLLFAGVVYAVVGMLLTRLGKGLAGRWNT